MKAKRTLPPTNVGLRHRAKSVQSQKKDIEAINKARSSERLATTAFGRRALSAESPRSEPSCGEIWMKA
jgi:hypothetical protein